MAVTAKLFGPAMRAMMDGDLQLWIHDVKVMLCTAVTFNQDAATLGALTHTEVSGASQGYTTGGKDITPDTSYASRVSTFDDTANSVKWDNSTITASHAIIYANSRPIVHINFDGEQESVDGDFELEWHANGIFTVTVAS